MKKLISSVLLAFAFSAYAEEVTVPVTINGLSNLTATFTIPDSPVLPSVAPETYESKTELRTSLPLTQGSPYTLQDIYRVVIPGGVKLTDKVHVNMQWEATTQVTTYNIMIGRCIAANQTMSDAPLSACKIESAAENLIPAEHHKVVMQQGWLPPIDTNGQDLVIHAVGYAGSTAAPVGATVKIEQGYGHLQAAVWRGDSQ